MLDDVLAVTGDEHFLIGFEEELDPLPRIGDQARRSAGRLEDACSGREADVRHAVASDVEHRQRGAVERIMLVREHMADMSHVRGHGLRFPTIAADQESALRKGRCGFQEKLLDPRFAVGEPVSEEGQVGRKARVRLDGAMRGGVERIVHGYATRRSKAFIGFDDRRPTSVGQYQIEGA
jgi:hypothetical protein